MSSFKRFIGLYILFFAMMGAFQFVFADGTVPVSTAMSWAANIIDILIKVCESVPFLGKYLAFVVQITIPLMTFATAFVALWHGVALFVKGLGAIIGSSAITSAGNWMCTTEAAIQGVEDNYISPILNRLSAIPLPKAAVAPSPLPLGKL